MDLILTVQWTFIFETEMVIFPPVKPERLAKYLKPYVLKMHFTNKFVSAQVIHSPTATVASAASSQEKALRSSMESTRDVAAAAKIGKILGERLLLKDIPAVSVFLKREQKYHGKAPDVGEDRFTGHTVGSWQSY
ncbi:unnamed protein product [Thlaspi arvense]|uniref:Uncharacterized protein n=1 Tax=Thlaspi arvense TaxID=13288 RepID=A0AAU9SX04_THLAR|nr:unnamed protein product [Thlaspi arvense]